MRNVVLILLLVNLSSCWMFRAYKVRKLNLTDHERLPSVTIEKSDQPYIFISNNDQIKYKDIQVRIDSFINNTQTAAFLLIRNDTLIYERYFMGFNDKTLFPSNSMAKSYTGTLVGMAIADGLIKSDLDPITKYLPELGQRDPRFHQITIRHLLDMRSGLRFNEGAYNLRDDAVKLGFRPKLEKHILKINIKEAPGKFKYQSINTQLLGLIVQRASGKPLQQYLKEKIWDPIGTEYDATWNVDSKKRKQVMMSAAINATAHDYAKFGRLYLKNGQLNGKTLIKPLWVRQISSADTMEKYEGYKNQWWNSRVTQQYKDSIRATRSKRNKKYTFLQKEQSSYSLSYRTDAYSANGFMNQIIYIHPKKNIIIVRLGKLWPDTKDFTQTIFTFGESL